MYFNLISIDPGSNLGVSILTVDYDDLKIKSIETTTINLNRLISSEENVQLRRILAIRKYIKNLLVKYEPEVFGFEEAFLDVRYPKAVTQLSQYTITIEQVVKKYDDMCKIFKHPPKYIKKYIGAGGRADKHDMSDALSKHKELDKYLKDNFLTEHEVDALALAVVCLERIRKNPLVMCAI